MLLLINCLARAESVPHFLPHFHFSALIFAPYRVHVIGIKCTVYHTLCSQFSTTDSNFLGSSPTGHPTKKSADALHRRIFYLVECPVGCWLACGSQLVGMSTKGDAMLMLCIGGFFYLVECPVGLEQQRRRPRPAAETGRSCWGSVLIFQSPAKGLRKNQQTQPVRP